MPIPLLRYKTSLIKNREPINKIKKYYNIWGYKLITRPEAFAPAYTYIFKNILSTNGILKEVKIHFHSIPPFFSFKIFKKTITQFKFIKEYILDINSLDYTLFCNIPLKTNYTIGFYGNGTNIYRSNIPSSIFYYKQNVNVTSTINIADMTGSFSKEISLLLKVKYKKDKHYAI